MYKLAIFDLDGTLLNSKHKISKSSMKALQMLKEKNIKVTIATGRSNELIKPFLNQLNMKDDVITSNGSVIGHPDKKEMLYEAIIPKDEVRKVLELCRKYHHDFLIYTSKAIVARSQDWRRFLKEKGQKSNDEFNAKILIIEDIDDIIDNYNVNKILMIERDIEQYETMKQRVQEFTAVGHTQSTKAYLDIVPLNNSKGKAVRILCKKLNIDLSEVAAFGDQMNDISMLEIAGLSIAMGNAVNQVKDIADYITLSNDENGIAYAIKEKIL